MEALKSFATRSQHIFKGAVSTQPNVSPDATVLCSERVRLFVRECRLFLFMEELKTPEEIAGLPWPEHRIDRLQILLLAAICK